jgi:hypothetical protein
MLGEGLEPSESLRPRRPQRRASAVSATPARADPLRARESNPPLPVPKTGVATVRPPRKATMNPARLERAASTFARLRSDPPELRVRKQTRNAERGTKSKAFQSIVQTSAFLLAEGVGVEPTGAVAAPTVFKTARRARAQPSVRCTRGDSNPHARKSHSFTDCCRSGSASGTQKLMKAEGVLRPRTRGESPGCRRPKAPCLHPSRDTSVVKQQKERAFEASHRKQARSERVSRCKLESWEREARPRRIKSGCPKSVD